MLTRVTIYWREALLLASARVHIPAGGRGGVALSRAEPRSLHSLDTDAIIHIIDTRILMSNIDVMSKVNSKCCHNNSMFIY